MQMSGDERYVLDEAQAEIKRLTAENARLRGELAASDAGWKAEADHRNAGWKEAEKLEAERNRLRGEVDRLEEIAKRAMRGETTMIANAKAYKADLARVTASLDATRISCSHSEAERDHAIEALNQARLDLSSVTAERDGLLAMALHVLAWDPEGGAGRTTPMTLNEALRKLRACIAACAPPASGEVKP
jgi:multidrug resistance efflux pump